jgi:hypothetical protein
MTNISIYADDTAFWTSHKIPEIAVFNLQTTLDIFSNHCNKWKIKLNPSKTVALVFSYYKSSRRPINKLKLLNKYIKWSDHVKFQGKTTISVFQTILK